MKTKKKLLTAILLVTLITALASIFISGCPKKKVSAEEDEYLRVITEDTPFYSDKTADSPLFYLPYTYYVRVIERGEYITHVEYAENGASIDGYVPTNKLFADGLPVLNPFPSVAVITAGTAVLYKDYSLTSTLQYVFEGRKMYYYGKYYSTQGKTVYYVGYNDRLGYVKEEDLVPFTIAYHPNELTFLIKEEPTPETPQEAPQTTEEKDSVFNIRIAIIAVLGIAGVVALIVALGKRPKPAPAASYYDENDYE